MRFLADEHIPAGVIAALWDASHDDLSAAESHQGAEDLVHVAIAAHEGRIILTEDGDFPARLREAAVAGDPLHLALIHYRLDGLGHAAKMSRMMDAIAEIEPIAPNTIYSVTPTRVRSRAMSRHGRN